MHARRLVSQAIFLMSGNLYGVMQHLQKYVVYNLTVSHESASKVSVKVCLQLGQ